MAKHKKEAENLGADLLMLEMHKCFSTQMLKDIVFQKPKPKTIHEFVERHKTYREYIAAYDKLYEKQKAKLNRKIKAQKNKPFQKNEPSI